MQQDPNALFSQSLGASSNSENKNCATVVENCLYFYCSDHDLCLFFNEVLDKPRCQWFDPHKISKKTVLHGRHAKFRDCSCQTRVSRQTCIKNWILWHLPLKNNICTPAINHRWCLVILICASVRYSSCSMANRNRRHINCDKRQCGFRLSCESRVLLCPLSVKSKNMQSRDVVCNNENISR